MKRNLLTLAAAVGIGVMGIAIANSQGGPGAHSHGFALEHLSKSLNLTADQQAKVQPILNQARPQLLAIHQEAMQKAKAIHDNVASQIRPLLNTQQQQQLDQMQKAQQDMASAMQEMHNAKAQGAAATTGTTGTTNQ